MGLIWELHSDEIRRFEVGEPEDGAVHPVLAGRICPLGMRGGKRTHQRDADENDEPLRQRPSHVDPRSRRDQLPCTRICEGLTFKPILSMDLDRLAAIYRPRRCRVLRPDWNGSSVPILDKSSGNRTDRDIHGAALAAP